MWFKENEFAAALKAQWIKVGWLVTVVAKRARRSEYEVRRVIQGKQAADRETAESILHFIDFLTVVHGIDWRRTQYAGI